MSRGRKTLGAAPSRKRENGQQRVAHAAGKAGVSCIGKVLAFLTLSRVRERAYRAG